jgi:rod shape-determining protein MreD
MKAAGVFVAIALALALQTTLGRVLVAGTAAVDLVLVAVVYVALTSGPGAGMLAGSLAGLVQDSLSSGVIGIGGLAKCIVGFVVGGIGQQFIVTAALPRVVTFIGSTFAHAVVFMGLYVLLGLRTFPSPWSAVLGQAVGNSVVGMVAFTIIESLPGALERRRAARRPRR